MLSWVLTLVLASSMPTIAIPDIKDESKIILAKHERTVTTEKEGQHFVESSVEPGKILEGPFDTAREALIRSKVRSVEHGVKDIGGLKNVIRFNEGVRHSVYLDILGKLNIGVGFNLNRSDLVDKFEQAGIDVAEVLVNHVPLSSIQIDMLFDLSLTDALNDIRDVIKDFDNLSSDRQIALVDMMFQLGKNRFKKFKRMIGHVNNKNWPKAAEQLLDSRLALKQTPDRAHRNAERMVGVQLKRKISEPFFNPVDPETGEELFEQDVPIIAPRQGFVDIEPIPSPKLQQKFDEDLLQRLDGLPLGDLGGIALNMDIITEAGLEVISRKDLIKIIFGGLTLAAPSKGI